MEKNDRNINRILRFFIISQYNLKYPIWIGIKKKTTLSFWTSQFWHMSVIIYLKKILVFFQRIFLKNRFFCMVKYLNFHNSSFFCLKILFNVNGKDPIWHNSCYGKNDIFKYSSKAYRLSFLSVTWGQCL